MPTSTRASEGTSPPQGTNPPQGTPRLQLDLYRRLLAHLKRTGALNGGGNVAFPSQERGNVAFHQDDEGPVPVPVPVRCCKDDAGPG